jgi:hypothetical protein
LRAVATNLHWVERALIDAERPLFREYVQNGNTILNQRACAPRSPSSKLSAETVRLGYFSLDREKGATPHAARR